MCIRDRLEALSKGDGLYQTWLKENRVTKKELNQQRKTVFQENIKFSLCLLYTSNRPLDRLKDSLGLSRKKLYKEHYALKDCLLYTSRCV